MLGCGTWAAQVYERGGERLLFEIPWTSLTPHRVINGSGNTQVRFPRQSRSKVCEEIVRTCEPYRHEIVLWRGNHMAFCGPLVSMTVTATDVQFQASDLFHWLERRFFTDDFFSAGDLSRIFNDMANAAIALEPSINLEVYTKDVGIDSARKLAKGDFVRVSDALGDVARIGLDFTMAGRQLLAGELPDILRDELILTDHVCSNYTITREGKQFATDIAVFGQAPAARSYPVSGRATRQGTVYGLVQESFSEGTITDSHTAYFNAMTRLRAVQPAPLAVQVGLSDQAPILYDDLFPGIIARPHLYETGIDVTEEMLVTEVAASVSRNNDAITEEVGVTLVPRGPILAETAGIQGTTDIR